MNNTGFVKYYSEMDLESLIRLSKNPEKVNIHGISSLVNELEKRNQFELKESVTQFYLKKTNIDLKKNPKKLKINVWLVILLIGLLSRLMKSVISIYEDITPIINLTYTLDNNLIAFLKNDILLLLSYQVFASFVCILLIYMMLKFKRLFPKTMISFILISILISASVLVSSYFKTVAFSSDLAENEKLLLTSQIIFGIIWIVYLDVSDYIKETFIK